jgi:hypothetical protein
MTYVLTGSARVRLEPDATNWIVTIGYQEISP